MWTDGVWWGLTRLGCSSVFVHRHLLWATQRGLCVITNIHSLTHSHTHTHKCMCLDSANLMVFIPLLCLPSYSRSFLFSCPLHLFSSLSFCCLFLLFWLNYSCKPIVPNGLCTADTNVFISFRPCMQWCVFEDSA